jgi:hypothetical protein
MKTNTAAALAALAAPAASSMLTHCPGSSSAGCYSWAVPSASSSDIYFQISAPSSYTWIGLGLGSQMAGAEMFIIYQDGSGNVTLSTRTASGEVEPEYQARSGVELIAGSGVTGGKMVANVKCSGDCSSNMDRSGSNSWIGAWRRNGDLQSTSASAELEEHNDHFSFRVDMSQASVNSDSNPFVGTSQDSTKNNGNSNSDSNNSSGGSNSGVTEESSSASDTIINAHGIIMAIVFAILYPIGAILMPILASWIVHGGVQFIAFLAMWAGFGLGYYYANSQNTFFTNTHTRMGTIVVALLGIQPILGWIHHASYKRYQRRTFISHVHIWYGRILMALGIVNGGLGMQLASTATKYRIAYAVVSGVFGGLYIGSAIWGAIKRRRAPLASSKNSGSSG